MLSSVAVTIEGEVGTVARADDRWKSAVRQFLKAVEPSRRNYVVQLLDNPRNGGRGLRQWLRSIAVSPRPFPDQLPNELVDVYLHDTEAEPRHDCGSCGVGIPVHVDQCASLDGESGRPYFPVCPCCGGKTGLFAYWSSNTSR